MELDEIRQKALECLEKNQNVNCFIIQRICKIDVKLAADVLNWARRERWKEYAILRRQLEETLVA